VTFGEDFSLSANSGRKRLLIVFKQVEVLPYTGTNGPVHSYELPGRSFLTIPPICFWLADSNIHSVSSQAIYLLVPRDEGHKCNPAGHGAPFPPNITKAYLIYIVSLLILFANFYVMTYMIKKSSKSKKPSKSENTEKKD
jgi:GNS1/SUR4 family